MAVLDNISKVQTIILTSGYFDPLHAGHLEYLKKAKALGDCLVVIINTDQQAIDKKGYVFQKQEDRMEIVRNLKMVDDVFLSVDTDASVCKSIETLKKIYCRHKLIFAKGGDRVTSNIPEANVCKELGIEIVDGLGEKIRSSSEIVKKERKDENKNYYR